MTRCLRFAIVCAVVLVMASVVVAQQKPEPVTRLGDWVEIGNEVFMNIIASGDFRYNSSHNLDFEDRIRDRANSRDPFATAPINQESDAFFVQARWGADFRYQKNLLFQVILQWEGALDGNLIDVPHAASPGGTDVFGRGTATEDEATNLERLWVQYKFEGTPIRILVGADLWFSDQAGIIGDDDPRFALYLDLPNDLELGAWAVLQTSSLRLGLQNDHDFWYYVFHMAYRGMKPHVFGLDVVYFRDRSNLTPATANSTTAAFRGQKTDSVLIMPSWSGSFGPITALLQPMFLFGSVESCDTCAGLGGAAQIDYDAFAWAIVAYLEANLGMVRPFVGLFLGSADDDRDDQDLNGFAPLPQREITLVTATRFFGFMDPAMSFGTRDVVTPARSAAAGRGALFGGQEFAHTVGNPFNDRIANFEHIGLNHTYGNPGTLTIPVGVKIAPVKGHDFTLAYIYRAMLDSAILEQALPGVTISESLTHEIFLQWVWALSRHFDIRLSGNILIPGEGAKDIAATSTATATGVAGTGGGCSVAPTCEGNDVGFRGQIRFRAMF